MRSTFLGMELSKRSIQISQKSLDITTNNLSNTTTPGYTRQRVDINSKYLSTFNNFQTRTARLSIAGQGVDAYGVSQVRDPYIDKRYREMTCYVSEHDTKSSVMLEVQTTLDDIDNVGLAKQIERFKTSMQDYAKDPTNKESANIVRNQAYNMATMLRTIDTKLEDILQSNVFQMQTAVDGYNTLVDKIAEINETIVREYSVDAADKIYNDESVSASYGPNELLDQRNLLLDELSYYGNIHIENNHDGSVKVEMNGNTIVDGKEVTKIMMREYDNFNAAVLEFTNGNPVKLESGELKARQDLLNGNGPYANFFQNSSYGIPYYKTAVNTFAKEFADLMNEVNGVTFDDSTRAMFGTYDDIYDEEGNVVFRAEINASNIKISEEWMKEATMIGEVYDKDKDEWTLSKDGEHVNNFILAFDTPLNMGSSQDFDGSVTGYVAFLSNRLGQDIEFTEDQFDIAYSTANGLLDNRDAVSGVSDTEEGINMMNYQKWFNASSRMMTTLDDCLDKIINNMGRVGL